MFDIFRNFPEVKVEVRSNYEELRISNIQENHLLNLKYNERTWNVLGHNLPLLNFTGGSESTDMFANTSSLLNNVQLYKIILGNLEDFYDQMYSLDTVCAVVDPPVITPKTTWRLIKYNKNVFIKINIRNPLACSEASITFHGRTSEITELRRIYDEKSEDIKEPNIYRKLLLIFDIPFFPVQDEASQEDCSICLSDRCEDFNQTAIICCDNSKCNSIFHKSCLSKYFALNHHVKLLSMFIGECPLCKMKLSASYEDIFKNNEDEVMKIEVVLISNNNPIVSMKE